MNGATAGALLLALALIVLPPSPRRRLAPVTPNPRWRPRAAACLAVGVAGAAAALLPLTTVLAVAVVGATASARARRRHRIRCALREGQTLEGALDVLVGELRVGSHPVRAFGVAAGETTGAVAASLRSVAARARLGADVAAGLRAAAKSSALPTHWDRLALCWQLASDHGLAIATLMRA
uniref:type II secretion system F family protein n=2 Tax=unclassified Mycobacterium TaxID=2642494 RepID=UPI0006DCAE7D